jgi:hypothetical protein
MPIVSIPNLLAASLIISFIDSDERVEIINCYREII